MKNKPIKLFKYLVGESVDEFPENPQENEFHITPSDGKTYRYTDGKWLYRQGIAGILDIPNDRILLPDETLDDVIAKLQSVKMEREMNKSTGYINDIGNFVGYTIGEVNESRLVLALSDEQQYFVRLENGNEVFKSEKFGDESKFECLYWIYMNGDCKLKKA